jgi:hypothetical protein
MDPLQTGTGNANLEEDFINYTQVPWEVEPDRSGMFFRLATPEDIHAAMTGDAPLPAGLQAGANAVESYERLKTW